MNEHLFAPGIDSTQYPELFYEKPWPYAKDEFMKLITMPHLDLSEVSDHIALGAVVLRMYPNDPIGTINLIKDMAELDMNTVRSVIGTENMKKILKLL